MIPSNPRGLRGRTRRERHKERGRESERHDIECRWRRMGKLYIVMRRGEGSDIPDQ
jgi:hypothetical protein